ncbi:Methionine gamma-lyase [anaerobic digester metagenome]
MIEKTRQLLKTRYRISDELLDLHDRVLEELAPELSYYDEIREYNQLKVTRAFHEERISDSMFSMSSGYGYGDLGRDKLDAVYARVFGAESALVRPHFVNGTHAITAALFGNLRPGDTLMTITGRPYDTLHNVIGIGSKKNVGSLMDYGVNYLEVDFKDGLPDKETIRQMLAEHDVKMVHIQRSTGYSWRPSMNLTVMADIIRFVKEQKDDIIIFVDNCYGEFIETVEPTELGADLIAGSLIKNPGGSIAPTGGYIAGRADLVEQAAYRLTVPGIGGECGSTFGVTRLMFQGFFLAPHISMEAVKGAIFCARLMEHLGYEVKPRATERRTDIIQAIRFGEPGKLIRFVKGIQYGAPVDSFVECEPWDMPGYDDQVIMASGSFIQGSSIELSCDAPIREPYIAYLQGGITFDHARTGILIAVSNTLQQE